MSQPLRRYIGLLIIGIGVMIGPLDTSVNIAFPHIIADLNQPMTMIQWLVTCYVLTYASLILIFGKLGDLYGQHKIFCIGLVISIFALLLISFTNNFNTLLFFRFLQGIGTGLLTSVAPAMMISLYPEKNRAYAVGLFTLFFAIGGLLGPIIGGILIDLFDWRAVFWFRIPIAISSLILLFLIPKTPKTIRTTSFDFLGSITLVLSLAFCLITLNLLHRLETHGIWPLIAYASASAFFIFSFVKQEGKANDPILDLKVFKNISFVIINLASCLLYLVTFTVILIIPFALYRISSISTNEAGFILSIGFVGASLAGIITGRLIGPFKVNHMCFTGILLAGIGLSLMACIRLPDHLFFMAAALFLQGFGTGLFQTSYLFIITGMLPDSQRGVSGSIAMLTRTIGVVSGVSLLTLAFSWFNKTNTEAGLEMSEIFHKSFQQIFGLAGGTLLLFLLITLIKPRVWFGKKTKQV